jgi:hypothetical protein
MIVQQVAYILVNLYGGANMFAAISILPFIKKNILLRMLDSFVKKGVRLYEIDTGFVNFFIIEAQADEFGIINWKDVLETADKADIKNLLPPRNIHPADIVSSMICETDDYISHYCFRIARLIAKASKIPASQLHMGLIDIDGLQDSSIVMKILSFASEIKIITNHESHYSYLNKWVSSSPGSPLFISNNADLIEDCQIIMAPFGVNNIYTSNLLKGILISSKPVPVSWKGFAIDSFTPDIPKDLDELRPDGISPLDFASALWKYCGLAPLGRLPVADLFSRGKKVSLKEISKILDSFDSV